MQCDVVIVGHQSGAHIERAIGKLPSIATVIVVDNASTDNTVEVARSAGAHVVANDVNAGYAAAANQGAAIGDAPLVLFLNPDATIEPDDVERMVSAFERSPRLGIASPRIRHDDGREQRTRWPFPTSGGAWREALFFPSTRRSTRAGFVVGACFLVRRDTLEELGGFDTRYWLYGEETDLCARAVDAAWRVELLDDTWVRHVGGASRHTAPGRVFEHFERGGERFVADREGLSGLESYRIAKMVGSVIRMALPGSPERRALHRDRLHRYVEGFRLHPWSVGLDSPATRAPGKGLVVLSLEAWDDVWRRNQFLVRELLARDPHLRVLFVEPAFDWIHERRRRSGRTWQRGLRSVRPDGRVLALEPVKTAPRALGGFADRSLHRQVLSAVEELGFDTPALWINDASFSALLSAGWPTLYDITDDWLLASGPPRVRRRLAENETRLLQESDAVVVCSLALAESRRRHRGGLHVVPNAVDVEHFATPRARPSDLPPAPVAVYVGTLHDDRIDVDLVERLASDLPEVHFAFVGPDSLSSGSAARLERHANVALLGARPYEEVPGYLQHADVVVVPHVVSPFTESLDPIKAYECLAVGRPTVATPVAGFRGLGAPIVVSDPQDFSNAVEAALGTSDVAACDVPDWTSRAQEFALALQGARARRGVG